MQSRHLGILLSIFAAAGAGVELLIDKPAALFSRASEDTETLTSESADSTRALAPLASHGIGSLYSDRSSYYETIAPISDQATLVQRIRLKLAEPASPARNWQLEVLFHRLFEIHPDSSLPLLQAAVMSHRLRYSILRDWVHTIDNSDAMESLARISAPVTAQLYAVALLEVRNADGLTIEQLVSRNRALTAASLELALLEQRAEHDPDGALADALQLDGDEPKRQALVRIARKAADIDPLSAISSSTSIQDEVLQAFFLSEVFQRWVRSDLHAFIEFVSAQDPDDPRLMSSARALQLAGESAPAQLLAAVEGVQSPVAQQARQLALAGLAAVDPKRALAYLEVDSAPEDERDVLLESIAQGYARYDLDEALAWLASLEGRDKSAVHERIVSALSTRSLEAAINYELEDGRDARPSWLMIPMLNDLANPAMVADHLLEENAENMLGVVLRRWGGAEPFASLDWIRQQRRIPEQSLAMLAQALGERNLRQAVDLAELLPSQYRGQWLVESLTRGSMYDPHTAVEALSELRREPFYEDALTSVVTVVMANFGPQMALKASGSFPPQRVAVRLASRWTEEDPVAAAQWAMSFPTPEARTAVVEAVVRTWVQRDPDAARGWASNLPEGTTRSRALAVTCSVRNPDERCD